MSKRLSIKSKSIADTALPPKREPLKRVITLTVYPATGKVDTKIEKHEVTSSNLTLEQLKDELTRLYGG